MQNWYITAPKVPSKKILRQTLNIALISLIFTDSNEKNLQGVPKFQEGCSVIKKISQGVPLNSWQTHHCPQERIWRAYWELPPMIIDFWLCPLPLSKENDILYLVVGVMPPQYLRDLGVWINEP